nr:RecName: Full=Mastoparan-X; Short=MP-X; Short=MPX [Vespa simillima xanthoptera]P0C1M4.1 RecName: Full=Mastoparan-like peptide 12a [Vespa magnifica]
INWKGIAAMAKKLL